MWLAELPRQRPYCSPSALRCQVAGDKHARMERKKAARRRKREEAMQGTFSAGPAAPGGSALFGRAGGLCF